MKSRIYFVDWLKIILTALVIVFHCALLFSYSTWHLNNPERTMVAHVFVGWLDSWFMPLFFLLAGFSSFYSLKHRSKKSFIINRVKRLIIPLYFVGFIFILFPQFYFELVSNVNYSGGFLELVPAYLKRLTHFNLTSPMNLVPLPFAGHLWFLQFLFLISLFTIPFIGKIKIKLNPVIALLILLVIRIGLRSFFDGEHNWADFVEFTFFYILGNKIASDKTLLEKFVTKDLTGLFMGLIGFGIGSGVIILLLGHPYPERADFSLTFVLFETFFSIGRQGWILFALSIAYKHLNKDNKFLNISLESTFPIYIIHQTVILVIAWFIIQLQIVIAFKFILVLTLSILVIFLLYYFVIRKVNLLRFAFGMRTNK